MAGGPDPEDLILHASCVSTDHAAALITGASGSGKSGLALALMAHGARLVADDRVILRRVGARIEARAPAPLRGIIEARGVGLLNARVVDAAVVTLVVDLDSVETERLPAHRRTRLLGREVALLHKVDSPHFPAALMQYMACGRHDPEP